MDRTAPLTPGAVAPPVSSPAVRPLAGGAMLLTAGEPGSDCPDISVRGRAWSALVAVLPAAWAERCTSGYRSWPPAVPHPHRQPSNALARPWTAAMYVLLAGARQQFSQDARVAGVRLETIDRREQHS